MREGRREEEKRRKKREIDGRYRKRGRRGADETGGRDIGKRVGNGSIIM